MKFSNLVFDYSFIIEATSFISLSVLLELVIRNLRFIIIPGEMYLEQGNYSFLSRRIILAGSKGKLGHLFRGFLKVGNSSKTFPPFCPNFYLSLFLFSRGLSRTSFSSRDKSKYIIYLRHFSLFF